MINLKARFFSLFIVFIFVNDLNLKLGKVANMMNHMILRTISVSHDIFLNVSN